MNWHFFFFTINFDTYSEVSIHFNTNGHKEDFSLNQDNIRKSIENDLINLFLEFNIPIINIKIPKINYIIFKIFIVPFL